MKSKTSQSTRGKRMYMTDLFSDDSRSDKFVKYLKETLIPDLYESGRTMTAEDFEQAVMWIEAQSKLLNTFHSELKNRISPNRMNKIVEGFISSEKMMLLEYCGEETITPDVNPSSERF